MNPNPSPGDRPARILIVDDEPRNQRLLEAMLASEGYQLAMAATGEEALALVAEHPPNLIVLDVMLPGIDGYQVAATVRQGPATNHIPIIMLTALDDRRAPLNGLSAGAEEFLTWPLNRAELCMRIRNLLRLKAYGDYYGDYSATLERQVASRTADLVERTRSLEAQTVVLRQNQERTNYALGGAGMGVWELDPMAQTLTWSETMPAVFGLTPDQVPTSYQDFLSLIHPDDRHGVQESVLRAARTRTAFASEFRIVCPDASTHWIAGRATLVDVSDGTPIHFLGVCTDVSDRKALEGQFRQMQKMEAVGQLAGGVAHDFNNLLTAILGYAGFVLETLAAQDPRRDDMEEVIKAGQRAALLTKQLLAFSRKQLLQPTVIDLNALVTGIRQMLGRLIGAHVELVAILAPELSLVRADRGQIEQVLMNLVINARDAMPSGGRLTVETADVEIDGTFETDAAIRPGRYVMLAVSDSGVGMDAATKHRLFEPFFTTKPEGQGTGLGLATVHGIVKQSGGHVRVYSEPGEGATFKVFLPSTDEQATSPPRLDQRPARGTETVLVVEHESAVRLLMRTMLERSGYRVFDASNPKQALDLFEAQAGAVQLLVTNVSMPGCTGPRLFEQLVQQQSDIKVLYVSGYTDDAMLHTGRLPSDVGFLQKPFTAEALSRWVRTALDH